MKPFITLCGILLSLSITAQQVRYNTNEPAVNDSAGYYLCDSNVTNYSGVTGAGVTWDYSSISTYSFDSFKKAKAEDARKSQYFNFYPYAVNDDYIENHLHVFSRTTANGRTSYGMQLTDENEGDILITYDGHTDRRYPWSYQSTADSSLSNCKIVLYPNSSNPPQIKGNANGIYSSLVDAYGSLSIGDTVIADVLRNQIKDSIRANLVIAGTATLIRTQYEYYAPGMTFPVFIHSHVKIYGAVINTEYSTVLSQVKPKISTGVYPKNDPFVIDVFPNPTTGLFVIEADPSIRIDEIRIYDMIGKIKYVDDRPNHARQQLDVTHLENGVYHIQIMTESGTSVTKRFVKYRN